MNYQIFSGMGLRSRALHACVKPRFSNNSLFKVYLQYRPLWGVHPPSPEGCQQWQTFDNLWTLCRSTRGQSLRWLWSYSWISRTTFRNSLVTESLNALRNTLLTSATTSVGYFQRCISAITPNPRGFLWVAGVSLLLQCLFVRLFVCLFVCTNL